MRRASQKGPGATLIVGFDTEYERSCLDRNDVLCLSFAALDPETGAMESGVLPVTDGNDRRSRPTLGASLARVVSAAWKAGIIPRAPDRIVLAAHWSRADLPTFRDFPTLKDRFDSPRKTFATTTKPAVMTLPLPSGPRRVSVTLVDTMLLAPAGQQSLKALGQMLDLPKLDLPTEAIERMREFQAEDPELFHRYAARDAEIAALYTHEVWRFLAEIGATRHGGKLAPTLGAAAVNLLRAVARERGIDLDAVLGYQRAVRRRVIAPELGVHLTTFAECFHGGRNEAYSVGYTPRTPIHDVDLCGAYSTALAHIREPAWGDAAAVRDVDTVIRIGEGLGFARARFRFPPGTRFPSLPVRAGQYGLVFPMQGVSWCTGFELALAFDQGAEIEVEHGVFVPWRSEVRPFAEFAAVIKQLRDRFQKGSLMERLAKEMGNSLYGKLAQQVAAWRLDGGGRRVFDSRAGEIRDMPPSSITCAPIAAAVTGLVRATMGELLALMPAEHAVFSTTTDGFLGTCSLDALRFGRVSKLFADARAQVADTNTIVEVKHTIRRALVWKTRGVVATEPCDPADPGKPVIARAGHRLDPRPAGPWQECLEWERLYRERDWDWRRTQRSMICLREQYAHDSDLVDVERQVRVNLEFDFKRRLLGVRDVDGLLAADTAPWRSVEEFLEARERFDLWRRSRRRVMKTAADHADFEAWAEMQPAKRQVGTRGDRPALAVLFLRAWARRALGLPGGGYAALAEAMTAARFPATVDAIKKARARGELAENRLEHLTPEEERFLAWVLERWPGFEIERLVAPGSPAAVAVTELRLAAAVPLLLPGISASGTGTRSDSPAQVAPAE